MGELTTAKRFFVKSRLGQASVHDRPHPPLPNTWGFRTSRLSERVRVQIGGEPKELPPPPRKSTIVLSRRSLGVRAVQIGAILNLRTTTSQKCAAVSRRACIQSSQTLVSPNCRLKSNEEETEDSKEKTRGAGGGEGPPLPRN